MRKCIFYLTAVLSALLPQAVFAQTKYQIQGYSVSFDTKHAAAKITGKIPLTEFSQEPVISAPAWGVLFSTADIAPQVFAIRLGKLSSAGLLSRLSSPALSSTTSALGSTVSPAQIVSINMPSASCNKPLAVSISADFGAGKNNPFHYKINSSHFVNEDGNIVDSLYGKIQPSKKTEIAVSAVTGRFQISNQFSTWFSASEYFLPQWVQDFALQASFSSPYFKTRSTACFFQSPYLSWNNTFSTENSLISDFFILNFGFFTSGSNEIFTSNSSQLKTMNQLKLNPILIFYPFANLLKVRMGSVFMLEEKIVSGNSRLVTVKAGLAVEARTKSINTKLSATVTDFQPAQTMAELLTGKSNVTVQNAFSQAKWAWLWSLSSCAKLKPCQSVNITFSPSSNKTTAKSITKLTLPVEIPLTATETLSFCWEGQDFTKAESTFSVRSQLKRKPLTVSCTAGISFNLYKSSN